MRNLGVLEVITDAIESQLIKFYRSNDIFRTGSEESQQPIEVKLMDDPCPPGVDSHGDRTTSGPESWIV